MESTSATLNPAGLLVGLFGLAFAVAALVIWVWSLVHAIGNKVLTDGERIMWVLLIVLVPFLGVILYFFMGRPKNAVARGNAAPPG